MRHVDPQGPPPSPQAAISSHVQTWSLSPAAIAGVRPDYQRLHRTGKLPVQKVNGDRSRVVLDLLVHV